MRNKIKFIVYVLAVLVIAGCGLTPQQRCTILRSTSSIGVEFALDRFKDKIDMDLKNRDKIVGILEKNVMPVLNREQGLVTKKQMDKALDLLDKNIKSDSLKEAIQASINSAMVLVEPMPKDGSVGDQILSVLKCVFLGILDALKGYAVKVKALKKKSPEPVKLYWYVKKT